MTAALFVMENGPYPRRTDIWAWTLPHDARRYNGPFPVIAHPPCARWGRYATGGPNAKTKRVKGADGGCFESALMSVRRFGGVLEHPADSAAWKQFGLKEPPRPGGWVVADWEGGWTCCVDQGHYGHRAQKSTWLYTVGTDLPSLRWGRAKGKLRLDNGHKSTEEGRLRRAAGLCGQRISSFEVSATPAQFLDLLQWLAESV